MELQRALDHLQDAERRLNEVPEWMRELHEQHSARKVEIAAAEEAVEQAGQERLEADTAIQDAQEKLKRYQQQINRVTNQREYGALLQEIDTVKGEISTCEAQGLAAIERIEAKTRELEELRQSFREIDERYAAELAKWEGEKPGVAREAKSVRKKIEELRGQLPKGVLALFERIRERYAGSGMAVVRRFEKVGSSQIEWHCSACNYRVRPQVVVEIRNQGSLVQCDSCKRILVIEEAAA
ncbi:MAG TPA: C4-type zinc ribbon domain-containing protein [Thermoanaerobaculia bacterium]|nr:C4-type zinc ribbon domain-containing protein [Thermoanaerobaculia bacterium]